MKKKEKVIYVVTYFGDWNKKSLNQAHVASKFISNRRSMAYFFKEKDAVKLIKSDFGNSLRAIEYNYAVIEETRQAVCVTPTKERWFHWTGDYEDSTVKEIKKPKELEKIVGFGMG